MSSRIKFRRHIHKHWSTHTYKHLAQICASQQISKYSLPDRRVTPHRCLPLNPASFREHIQGKLVRNHEELCSSFKPRKEIFSPVMFLFRHRGRAGSQNTVVSCSFPCPPFPFDCLGLPFECLLLAFGLLLLSFLSTFFCNPIFPLFASLSTFSANSFSPHARFVQSPW